MMTSNSSKESLEDIAGIVRVIDKLLLHNEEPPLIEKEDFVTICRQVDMSWETTPFSAFLREVYRAYYGCYIDGGGIEPLRFVWKLYRQSIGLSENDTR